MSLITWSFDRTKRNFMSNKLRKTFWSFTTDNNVITTVIFFVYKRCAKKKSHSFLFVITMKSAKVFFVLFSIVSMFLAVSSAPEDPESSCELFNQCVERNEEFFDRWVCATNGDEMRGFSGTCRMHQHNCKSDESNYNINNFTVL